MIFQDSLLVPIIRKAVTSGFAGSCWAPKLIKVDRHSWWISRLNHCLEKSKKNQSKQKTKLKISNKMNNRKDKWTYILEKQELRTKKTKMFSCHLFPSFRQISCFMESWVFILNKSMILSHSFIFFWDALLCLFFELHSLDFKFRPF